MDAVEIRGKVFNLPIGSYTFDDLKTLCLGTRKLGTMELLRFGKILAAECGSTYYGKSFSKEGGNRWRRYILSRVFARKRFSVPEGIKLARGGKAALESALASLRASSSVRPARWEKRPAIIVSGPPASGKTRLATALLEYFYGEAHCMSFPGNPDKMERLLECQAGRPYLWLEGMPPITPSGEALRSRTLFLFLSASTWSYRPIFTQSIETFAITTRVFITTDECPLIHPDLERRAIHVRLEGRAA